MTACAVGDLGAPDNEPTGPATPVASRSATLRSTALPIAEAPASATLPANRIDRAAFLTAAIAGGNAQLDVLAGVIGHLSATPPSGSASVRTAAYADQIANVWSTIQANSIAAGADASGTRHVATARLLERITPTLGHTPTDEAFRAFARDYLAVGRSGLNVADVQPFSDPQMREIGADGFRSQIWAKLHDSARADASFAQALDSSVVFTTIQVKSTDHAAALFARYPIEPLKSFLSGPTNADGSLTVTRAQIEDMVTSTTNLGIDTAKSYSAVIKSVSEAQETYLGKINPHAGHGGASKSAATAASDPSTCPKPPTQADKDELTRAIENAQSIKQGLDSTLDDVDAGVSGGVWVLSELTSLAGAPEFAEDLSNLGKAVSTIVKQVKDYADTAISVAKGVTKFLGYGETGFNVIGGAILTGGIVAAVFAGLSVFGSHSNPNAAVLEQLKKLQDMITDLKKDVDARFDRVDTALNTIYGDMMEQFAHIDYQLGVLNANIADVQAGLSLLQNSLNRIDHDLVSFLQAGFRQDLINEITGALNFTDVHGHPISAADFQHAENIFFAFATQHALNDLNAGASGRPTGFADVNHELSFPLHFNINYLNDFPTARFGLPKLNGARLANPYVWAMAAESYAQLYEESPTLANAINAQRLEQVTNEGLKLASALDAITAYDATGHQQILDNLDLSYRNRWGTFMAVVHSFETAYHADTQRSLKGVSIFGSNTQVPTDALFGKVQSLKICGDPSTSTDTLDVDFTRLDQSEVVPFDLASSLSNTSGANPVALGKIRACIDPEWELVSIVPPQNNAPIHDETDRLVADVNIFFKPQGGTEVAIFRHHLRTDVVQTGAVPNNLPNPNVQFGQPRLRIKTHLNELYAAGHDFRSVIATAAQRQAVGAAIDARFDAFQRQIYGQIAQQIDAVGTTLHAAADALSGGKKVWDAYVVLGLPLSVEQNEILHGLIFGGDGVFAGRDDQDNGLLDDARDMYVAFAQSDSELPSGDLLDVMNAINTDRANTMRDTIAQIVQVLNANGVFEGHELIGRTLLRLALLRRP